MALNIYDVIRRPRVTTKVYRLKQDLNQLVLDVHPDANKPMIAEALKKLFNMQFEKIRTVTRMGKTRMVGRRVVYGKRTKKAIIVLKKGFSFDAMNLPQSAAE